MKNLQDKIAELETLIMLNCPPTALLEIRILATRSKLTDKEYLIYLGQYLDCR